jgi:hypothetical protein
MITSVKLGHTISQLQIVNMCALELNGLALVSLGFTRPFVSMVKPSLMFISMMVAIRSLKSLGSLKSASHWKVAKEHCCSATSFLATWEILMSAHHPLIWFVKKLLIRLFMITLKRMGRLTVGSLGFWMKTALATTIFC